MNNFSKLERIAVGTYFVWFFIHAGLWLLSEDSKDNFKFWPFYKEDVPLFATYDFTEFIVYAGFPLVLLVGYRIIRPNDLSESSYDNRRPLRTFFLAFLKEKIKVAELQQRINELTNQPVDYQELQQLKKDLEVVSTKKVANWLERNEVKKRYKAYGQ